MRDIDTIFRGEILDEKKNIRLCTSSHNILVEMRRERDCYYKGMNENKLFWCQCCIQKKLNEENNEICTYIIYYVLCPT